MWIVPDYNITEFVKTLKTLVKIGPHVQIEPYDVQGLKVIQPIPLKFLTDPFEASNVKHLPISLYADDSHAGVL